jgi:LysM repeat protein
MPYLMRLLICLLIIVVLLIGCSPPPVIILVTATPIPVANQEGIGGGGLAGGAIPQGEAGMPATIAPTPTFIPTPNPTRSAVVDISQDQAYTVQSGDTLSLIGIRFGVSVETIMAANGMTDEPLSFIRSVLIIPQTTGDGPAFKIIPDSGACLAGARGFSVAGFLADATATRIYIENLTTACGQVPKSSSGWRLNRA